MTQFEMMTSTELSGSGVFSISPFKKSTLVRPLNALVFLWVRYRQTGYGAIAVASKGIGDAP